MSHPPSLSLFAFMLLPSLLHFFSSQRRQFSFFKPQLTPPICGEILLNHNGKSRGKSEEYKELLYTTDTVNCLHGNAKRYSNL